MDFRINTLIAWPKPRESGEVSDVQPPTTQHAELKEFRLERVLYVDAVNNELFAIDVHDTKAQLTFYSIDQLTASVTADQARIVVDYEPHPIITLTDEELGSDLAAHIAYRDQAWELIEPLVQLEIRKVFSRRVRGALIADIAKKTGRDKSKIRFQLRRYWQRGCVKNALFPDWHKRGLKGTELPSTLR